MTRTSRSNDPGRSGRTDGSERTERAGQPRPVGTTEDSDRRCSLCDLPTPSPPITDDDVDGSYCCPGCLAVARTLGDVTDEGPSDDTAFGKSVRDAITSDGTEGGNGTADTHSLDDLEGDDAFLAVDGMHCSTCEVFLEHRASSIDGVRGVEASYATDTIRIVYDDAVLDQSTLADQLSGYGYTARERDRSHRTRGRDDDLVKFLVGGGLFGMMVMVWYALFLYPTYFGYDPLVDLGGFDGWYVFANIWLMTTFVLFYTGYPILRGAVVSLRAGLPNMDLLVALAALSAYAYSTVAMLLGRTDLYFDVSVAIILVVTGGTYYEGVIKRRAAGLLSDLTEERVDEARLTTGETIPVDAVEPGDHLLVRPGERVPVDGVVHEGAAAIDESLVTGEALPVDKSPGDPLYGGTVVTDSPVVLAVGDEATSTLDRLVSLLWRIQSARPGVQRLADKLATIFVPLVVVLASGIALWLLLSGGSITTAILVGLTVLIVSCPCALGLATPLAIASGLQSAANRGIVVAAETIFEDAPDVDVVALDKTGTLTAGSMSVEAVYADDPERVTRRAAAVERLTDHPIATAITDHAHDIDAVSDVTGDGGSAVTSVEEGGTDESTDPDEFTNRSTESTVSDFDRTNRGVSGVVDGERVDVGHPDFLRERGFSMAADYEGRIDDARTNGHVPVAVGWNGLVRGVIVVGDSLRPEWKRAIERLGANRSVVVLTGDEGRSAERFRSVTGVDEVFAGVPPEAKVETVRRLRRRGTVAMVGDGSNDAPALAEADVGIAVGNATQLASDAADAIVVADDLEAVADTFTIARATNRRIKQNLGWAFVYNGIAIPLAITGLLNPLLAAVAMATSSTLVVLNSSRSM